MELDRPAPAPRGFARRYLGALRLEPAAYAEVEGDPRALAQAATVVAAGGLARGLGAAQSEGWVGLVGSLAAAFVVWFAAAAVVTALGVRVFGGRSDFDEMLRTLGFAAAPLALLALGLAPLGPLALPLSALVHGWAVVALVVATREALDVDTLHALWVCLCALGAGLLVVLLLGLLLAGRAWV